MLIGLVRVRAPWSVAVVARAGGLALFHVKRGGVVMGGAGRVSRSLVSQLPLLDVDLMEGVRGFGARHSPALRLLQRCDHPSTS